MKYSGWTGFCQIALSVAVVGPALGVCGEVLAKPGAPVVDSTSFRSTETHSEQSVRFNAGPGNSFVVDRSGTLTLMRVEGDSEVLALIPMAGPRGDVILKNDAGEMVLRVTVAGGVTMYSPKRPEGVPASEAGAAKRISAPVVPKIGFERELYRLADVMSIALARPIEIHAPEGTENALVTDAAARAAEGVIGAKHRLAGKTVYVVRIEVGRYPVVAATKNSLLVQIAPNLGYAGRPSSRLVQLAIEELAPPPLVAMRVPNGGTTNRRNSFSGLSVPAANVTNR